MLTLMACGVGVGQLGPSVEEPPGPMPPGPVPLPGPAPAPTSPPDERHVTVTSWTDNTGKDGILPIEIEVDATHKSFLLTTRTDDGYAGVLRVLTPDGSEALFWRDWWASDESLTWAVYAYSDTSVLNWPVRPEDDPLVPGTWTVEVYTLDTLAYYAQRDVQLDLFLSSDPDPTVGEVRVAIYFAAGEGTPEVVAATEEAVERWRGVWAETGLTLVERYAGDAPVDADMGFIYTGSDEMEQLLVGKPPEELVVLVGEAYGGGGYSGFYGVTGGIPGTLAESPWTWVTVSWLTHAGVDGVFNGDETEWMGDTMAHEVGHYVGLFHPVECPWECGRYYDAITDTPRCTGWEACQEAVGDNLMFPYAICDKTGCDDQTDLTADQIHVIHHYTGTQ